MSIKEGIIEEIHKPVRKNFERTKIIPRGINDLWQIDLVEMDTGNLKGISKMNKGFKYILTVIDTFSKVAWGLPLKNKTGKLVTIVFESILKNNKPIINLQSDKGKEFYSKDFQNLVKEYNINHYSTNSEIKAAFIERFNRTLKEKMWKEFSKRGSYKWIDILEDLIKEYNNSYHTTIKMKPIEVNKKNEKDIMIDIYTGKNMKNEKPKFKLNDYVRISKYKGIFEKGYTPNWSCEVFKISKIIYSSPITYKIKDLKEEEIQGKFYKEELMKTKYPHEYLVEKVLKRKGNKVYVKWLGFDNTHNTWINKSNLVS